MARNDYSSNANATKQAANDYYEDAKSTITNTARNIADDAKSTARNLADDAKSTVKNAADEASDALYQLSQVARDAAGRGFDQVSREVSRAPLTSLAIAAGVGLLFGLLSRSR